MTGPTDLGHPRHPRSKSLWIFQNCGSAPGLSGWPWIADMVGLLRRHPNLYCDHRGPSFRVLLSAQPGFRLGAIPAIRQYAFCKTRSWSAFRSAASVSLTKTRSRSTRSFPLKDHCHRQNGSMRNARRFLSPRLKPRRIYFKNLLPQYFAISRSRRWRGFFRRARKRSRLAAMKRQRRATSSFVPGPRRCGVTMTLSRGADRKARGGGRGILVRGIGIPYVEDSAGPWGSRRQGLVERFLLDDRRPRATLISTDPGFISARRRASIRLRVSLLSGAGDEHEVAFAAAMAVEGRPWPRGGRTFLRRLALRWRRHREDAHVEGLGAGAPPLAADAPHKPTMPSVRPPRLAMHMAWLGDAARPVAGPGSAGRDRGCGSPIAASPP